MLESAVTKEVDNGISKQKRTPITEDVPKTL